MCYDGGMKGSLVKLRFTGGWITSSTAGTLHGKMGMCLGRSPLFPELNYWSVLVGFTVHHLLEENFEIIDDECDQATIRTFEV
jgi:hypothetical protein